jgi:hypothetical protein
VESERVIAQLVGCAYEGASIRDASRALAAVGLLDREVLLEAARWLHLAPEPVRPEVYDLFAGVVGSLDTWRHADA